MTATSLDFGASNTTRYYTLTGPALPNADWCIGFWRRRDRSELGLGHLPFLTIGNEADGGSDQLGIEGGSEYFVADLAHAKDSAGNSMYEPAGKYANDALNYLVILQRRGANCEMYTVALGTTATAPDDSGAHGLTAGFSSQTWHFGARDNLDAFSVNPMGELFCLVSDSLSAAEVTTLAAGAHITAVRSTRALDLRFRASNTTESDLSGNGHDATQHGTGWATATEFFADSGSDTTAPSLTSGPTISNVTSGGFDISGTPDEGGTASLIYLSDVTASQPSDATFDASSETDAMTAATSFTIHHTGS